MMKIKTLKKWLLGTLVLVMILLFSINIFVKLQTKHHSGLNTPVVDAQQIKLTTTPLALTNISVISHDSSHMKENQTVLIKNGIIEKVGSGLIIPEEFETIDGKDKYLIPGLADTHAHTYASKNDLLLYLVNGVTQIAILSGYSQPLEWKQQAQEGALMPQIFLSTGGMNTKQGMMPIVRSWFGADPGVNSPDQAREAVRDYKAQGYDVVKVYDWLKKDIYYALLDEAKKQNIRVIGHLPLDIRLEELYQSGQSQLAHIEEITKATMRDFGGLYYGKEEAYLEYLHQNADAIAQKIKAHNITVSSTVWLMDTLPKQRFELDAFLKTIKLEYQNPGVIEGSYYASGWLPGSNRYEAQYTGLDPEELPAAKKYNETYVKAVHIMAKVLVDNGVAVITGTDSNTAGTVAGFSLHDELQSLAKAGLTNAQTLHAATLAPSQWMNFNSGEITEGYRADLVVLNQNPLENIKNTRSIDAVILNGKMLDRETLDSILMKIKAANNAARKVSIDAYH